MATNNVSRIPVALASSSGERYHLWHLGKEQDHCLLVPSLESCLPYFKFDWLLVEDMCPTLHLGASIFLGHAVVCKAERRHGLD